MNGIKLLSNTYIPVKIKTLLYSEQYIINKIIKSKIIENNKFQEFIYNKKFKDLIIQEYTIRNHPFFIKKIYETNDIGKYQIVNISHSPKKIKINQEIVTKTKVSSYWNSKQERIKEQYAPNASCIIELTKEEYNEMIQDISTNPDEINKLGGLENIKKITEKLENEWHNKPSYDYINYLKKIIIDSYENYEKDLIKNEEQYNDNKKNNLDE